MTVKQLFIASLLIAGLWLLIREIDHVAEEAPASIIRADAAASTTQRLEPSSSMPSSPPLSRLRSPTSTSERETLAIKSQPMELREAHDIELAEHLEEDVNEQIEEDVYIVDGKTLRPAIEEVEKVFSEVMARVDSAPPGRRRAMSLRISSAAGSAILDSQGFTLTNLEVAQRFGLQVGDTIVSMNGYPVDSPESAWWIFQEIFVRNRDVKELRLLIYRRGTRLHRTYWITWQ